MNILCFKILFILIVFGFEVECSQFKLNRNTSINHTGHRVCPLKKIECVNGHCITLHHVCGSDWDRNSCSITTIMSHDSTACKMDDFSKPINYCSIETYNYDPKLWKMKHFDSHVCKIENYNCCKYSYEKVSCSWFDKNSTCIVTISPNNLQAPSSVERRKNICYKPLVMKNGTIMNHLNERINISATMNFSIDSESELLTDFTEEIINKKISDETTTHPTDLKYLMNVTISAPISSRFESVVDSTTNITNTKIEISNGTIVIPTDLGHMVNTSTRIYSISESLLSSDATTMTSPKRQKTPAPVNCSIATEIKLTDSTPNDSVTPNNESVNTLPQERNYGNRSQINYLMFRTVLSITVVICVFKYLS